MRLVLRTIATWLVGLAVVLLVIDGTRSLGVSRLVLSSLQDTWSSIHPQSLAAVRDSLAAIAWLDGPAVAVFNYPAFAVVGVPGLLLMVLGRARRRERYIQQDQI